MAVYADNNLARGDVPIGAPTAKFQSLPTATACCDQDASDWLRQAEITENIYCFAIYWSGIPIGHILLHDFDWATGESLIRYLLFEQRYRRREIRTVV